MARTLEEMAEILKVSRRTISRFIQGKGYLSKKNSNKIGKFLAKEAYYPNVLGSRLASRRVPVLGVLFPEADPQDGGYFFLAVMQGVWAAAGRRGMQVMHYSRSPFQLEECLRLVKSKAAGGLLFVSPGASDAPLFKALTQEGVPCVTLNARFPGVDSFACDNRAGARDAVRHLIAQGCKRIAFLHGHRDWFDAEERFLGYRSALQEAGRPFSNEFVGYGRFSIHGGEAATAAFLTGKKQPDALFAANDLMAVGAVQALRKRGLRIPQDVRVIGFDDLPFCRLPILEPTLSSVSQPFRALSEAAASRLADIIQGAPRTAEGETHLFPPTLMVRGSTQIEAEEKG